MGRVQDMIDRCLSNGRLADGDFDDRIMAALTALPENKARYCMIMHKSSLAARPTHLVYTASPSTSPPYHGRRSTDPHLVASMPYALFST